MSIGFDNEKSPPGPTRNILGVFGLMRSTLMSANSVLRRPLVTLGQAMRPLAASLGNRLDQPQLRTANVSNMPRFISRYMTTLSDALEPLIDGIRSGFSASSDADAHRAVGRLEIRLELLVASYDEVRRASPELGDIEGWSLLIELYRDTLLQIKGWLDDIADILNDPITELERRGLPTKGEVNIPINLRPPEELEMLKRWVNQRTSGLKAASRTVRSPHQQSPSRGLWTGFGLGLLVGLD